MTSSHRKYAVRFLAILTTFIAVIPQAGESQLNSNVANVVLTATLLESLSITALPSAVAFNLAPGGEAVGSTPVAVTTVWILGSTRTTVNLYANFSSSTIALTDGLGHNIASANIEGQMTTGSPTSYTAFTQTGPFGAAGASLKLFTQGIGLTNLSSTRTDNLNLEIDLIGTTVPAGVYVGTLNIQAQAL